MGSRHKLLLMTSGGGEKLYDASRRQYQNNLNDFLSSHGVDEDGRASAIAHFDMGYEDGYAGEVPYYGSDWDSPLTHEELGPGVG